MRELYFYLIIIPLLATAKVTIQAGMARKSVTTTSDTFLLNGGIFLASAITLAALFLRSVPPLEVFFFSLLIAVGNLLFQTFYVLAFRTGPVSLTTTINNFSLVLPMLTGAILYREMPSLWNVIGLPFLAAALILIPMKGHGEKASVSARWLLFALLTALSSGLNNSLILYFSRSEFAAFKSEFLIFGYLFSAVFALLFGARREKGSSFRFAPRYILLLLLIGLILGVHNLLNVQAISFIETAVFFPVTTVLGMLFVTTVDRIVFKQKLSRNTAIGFVLALIAVVFLSI